MTAQPMTTFGPTGEGRLTVKLVDAAPALGDWALDVFIPGSPAPQGSKKHVGNGVMIESSKKVKPWRMTIAYAVSQVWRTGPIQGATQVELEFVMPRPVATPKRRTPPAIKKPDLDKITRAVFDALTRIVWADDSRITDLRATKRLAELTEQPGVRIRVREIHAV